MPSIDAEAYCAVLGGKYQRGGLLYPGPLQELLDEELETDHD